MQKKILVFAGFSGAIAILLGAMAAHVLKSKLNTGTVTILDLEVFETAARYQMYHSIALLAITFLMDKSHINFLKKACYCFMIGIVLFSGSLYLLATANIIGLHNIQWLGPRSPVGGLFLIAGWLLIAVAGLKKSTPN